MKKISHIRKLRNAKCDTNVFANKHMSHDFETNKIEQDRLLEALKLLSSDVRLLSEKERMILDYLGDYFVVNSTNTSNLEHNIRTLAISLLRSF